MPCRRILTELSRAAAVLAMSFACASAAHAEEEDPKILFGKGEAAAKAGDNAAAGLFFERAALARPKGAAHLAAARAFEASGNAARAADHYARAEVLGVEQADQAQISASLVKLRATLGAVLVQGAGEAYLEDGVRLPLPATFHQTPGEHRLIVIRGAGAKEERFNVTLFSGAVATFVLPARKPRTQEQVRPEPEPEPQDKPMQLRKPFFIIGLTGFGLAVVGGATTIGLGVATNAASEDYEAKYGSNPPASAQDEYDSAYALRDGTNAAIGVTVGMAAIGGAFFIASFFMKDDDGAAVGVSPSGVTLHW